MTTEQRPKRTCLIVVLAAGEGTRMGSSRPKVLHAIGGRSLIGHVLSAVGAIDGRTAVVVGPGQDAIAEAVKALMPGAECYIQRERRGTAHAVLAAKSALARGADDVVVAFADTPLITPQTISRLRGALAAGASPCWGFVPPTRPVTDAWSLMPLVNSSPSGRRRMQARPSAP